MPDQILSKRYLLVFLNTLAKVYGHDLNLRSRYTYQILLSAVSIEKHDTKYTYEISFNLGQSRASKYLFNFYAKTNTSKLPKIT